MSDRAVLDGELSLTNPLDGDALLNVQMDGQGGVYSRYDWRGYSAYEIAVQHGYTGTEEEWLASLHGADGATGPQGETGATGQQGPKGDKGDPGDDYTLTEQDKQDIAGMVDTPVDDVQINGTSIVQGGVANIPIAKTGSTDASLGLVRVSADYGLSISPLGRLNTTDPSVAQIKAGTATYRKIGPAHQHIAAFYGLTKAAGVDMASSSNPVGTYTDEAKAAIQSMLDVPSKSDIPEVPVEDVQIDGASILSNGVADIPIADAETLGVVGINNNGGVAIDSTNHKLLIKKATSAMLKAGSNSFYPVVSNNQHEAAFYGLAKASGDTTQSQSSNAVGTYTEDAKSAISDMLNGSVSVSGTTPTIVAKSGIRYVCGEVASLDFTPPASGICDVVFTSGTTPTVLTVPSTVKWANGFDPTSLDANTTYELNIMDGLGVCGTWT